MAKPLTVLTCQQAKFEWTPTHHNAFLTLMESVTQAHILYYPDQTKCYMYMTLRSNFLSNKTKVSLIHKLSPGLYQGFIRCVGKCHT